jgi:hypothetical protein
MQDWGRLDGGLKKMSHGLVHGVAGSIQTTENCGGKGLDGNRNDAVF